MFDIKSVNTKINKIVCPHLRPVPFDLQQLIPIYFDQQSDQKHIIKLCCTQCKTTLKKVKCIRSLYHLWMKMNTLSMKWSEHWWLTQTSPWDQSPRPGCHQREASFEGLLQDENLVANSKPPHGVNVALNYFLSRMSRRMMKVQHLPIAVQHHPPEFIPSQYHRNNEQKLRTNNFYQKPLLQLRWFWMHKIIKKIESIKL